MAADAAAPETLYLQASLLLVQTKREEATRVVMQLIRTLLERTGAADDSEDEENEGDGLDESLPEYGLRVSAAKLMMEVGQPAAAAIVLERCLLEDDGNSEVWFLIAAAYRDSKRPALARQYLNQLLEVCVLRVAGSAFVLDTLCCVPTELACCH
jgi:tetratricopeptide (TPR) repeat protein